VLSACAAYIVVSIALVWLAYVGNIAAQVYTGDITIVSSAGFFAAVLLAAEVPLLGRLRPLTFVGDISYSIYLLHVPLQLGIFVLSSFWHPIDFSRPGAFWIFFTALFVLSALSFRFLERPALLAIRSAFTM